MTSWCTEVRVTRVQLRKSALSNPPSVVCCPNHLPQRPGPGWQGCPNQPAPQAPPQITRWELIKVCMLCFSFSQPVTNWNQASLWFQNFTSDTIFLFNPMTESKMLFLTAYFSSINMSEILCTGYYLSAQLWKHLAGTRVAIMTPVMESTVSEGDCLMFWYHMEGSGVGELSVYLQGVDESRQPVSWNRGLNQGNHWRHGRVTLSSRVPFQVHGCLSGK